MRKIVQISVSPEHVMFAVCDDGSVWYIDQHGPWRRLPDIPQDAKPGPQPEERGHD